MIHKEQRVGIFIDVQNLYHSAKNLYKARVNFKELIKHLVNGRKLIRSIAYVVKTEGTEAEAVRIESSRAISSEAAFFDALKQAGIELRMKDIQIFPGGMKKADWDVGMAVDAIRMGGFLDVIILVTGDGDFLPLVDYAKWGLGRVVEVAAFSRTTSSKLKEEADQFIGIEDIPRVLIKK
ncbi:MAG: NYN domain-containing protein [bacterium]|nr:NYN domain-containing protein [bacterium]